ncbi:uncharacterized protein LOC132205944 [Neocloeon triangulifer]|uniref:uncharacterized protein LOC132205944 n=1 Tax=Neocloeon triangulifer TaxID=2078957 RepID=UPI00286EEA7D|nr:uncharacterized protein LOC132205944 [Neocloeon triangulifer]
MRFIVVLSCLVAATVAAGLPEAGDTLGFVYRVWDDCNNKADLDLASCLKVKLATAVSRAARMNDLTVFDGVTFVRTAPNDATPETSEEAVEASLPRSADARDDTLSALILERAAQFFQTHSLSVKVPEFAERSLSAGDARGKIKKIAPLLLLPLLKAGLLIPLAIGALFLLAGKALIISKLALLLSGIIGLKKLLSGGHGHVETAYVSSGAGHGWGRSEEAQNLAYSAHAN